MVGDREAGGGLEEVPQDLHGGGEVAADPHVAATRFAAATINSGKSSSVSRFLA